MFQDDGALPDELLDDQEVLRGSCENVELALAILVIEEILRKSKVPLYFTHPRDVAFVVIIPTAQ